MAGTEPQIERCVKSWDDALLCLRIAIYNLNEVLRFMEENATAYPTVEQISKQALREMASSR